MTKFSWIKWIRQLPAAFGSRSARSLAKIAKPHLLNLEFLEERSVPAAFTSGNIALLDLAAASKDTTASILELNPALTSQTSPIQTIPVSSLYFSNSGTSSFIDDTADGSLLTMASYNGFPP